MKFACDSCGSQYMISDDKVGPNGVKVRCKKCGNVVSVKRAAAPAAELRAPTPAPAASRPESGAPETTLERELGSAFDNAFGGSSPAGAAETRRESSAAASAAASAEAGAEARSDWYVAVNDQQVGPLAAAAVKSRWESGEVGPDTLAWRPGMADWVPLSSIGEMAQYLAPAPRPAARPAARPAPAEVRNEVRSATPAPVAATPSPTVNGAVHGANGAAHGAGFKPSAGSALAALASEEMASLARPEPKKEAPAAARGSLVDRMDLPDGGVDPTNLLPLPIKGLDPTTEATLKPKPAAASPAAPAARSGGRNVLAVGVALAVLFAGALGVVLYVMRPSTPPTAAPAPAAAPAPIAAAPAPAATPPPAASPSPAAAAPAPAGTPTSTSTAGETASAAAPAATPPAAEATPAPAAAPAHAQAAAPTPPPAAAAPARATPPPERLSRAERRRREAAARREDPLPRKRAAPERVAAAQPAPEPPPPAAEPPPRRVAKPAGDPLLDTGGDDELEKELGGGKAPKRSVYVPPALGADLPESVSVAQINEGVAGQMSALKRCIDQQRAAEPEAKGVLRLRWLISGDGTVRDVRVLTEEYAKQPIAPCITGVVKGIRFPKTRTTGQEVVFPFKF